MNMTDHKSNDTDHSGHSNMSHSMNHESMAMYFFTNNTNLICTISRTKLIDYNESLMYSKESYLA